MAEDDAATRTAVVFDLDGTLIDSVYQHVLAWREALEAEVPVITRDAVRYAKPAPDLCVAAAEALKIRIEACIVVGDSVWDLLAARRAHALGVGLLSGGYGEDELVQAGAFRVYEDPG